MQIYPSIDLRNGQCVRLRQGRFDEQTTYSHDPLTVAGQFAEQGATWLHVVDLDGAKDPSQHQRALIGQLLAQKNLNFQIGGGIRTQQDVEDLLALDAQRVVVGSLVVSNPALVKHWLNDFGSERIVLALDVTCQDGATPTIAFNAWQSQSQLSLYDCLADFTQAGAKHILCTDISRDGTLDGTNIELYQDLLARFPNIQLQASGGIHSVQQIQALRAAGLAGAVIGKALYEKQLTLQDALHRDMSSSRCSDNPRVVTTGQESSASEDSPC